MPKTITSNKATVTRTKTFAAIIKSAGNGRKSLVIRHPAYYQNELNKFKDGTNVTLEIHDKRPKRSEEQNRYYWGVYLPLISESAGQFPLYLHALFSGKFLTEQIVEVMGEKVRIKKSTTELSVSEFCKYIMDIEELTGIQAPPTENYNLVSLQDGIKKS